ncbi:MAG: PilZ protein [Conexibacter sp.]|nr:PilZ protein [Conexibacter sp.]
MAQREVPEQRTCPRIAVALDLQLGRKVGTDVAAHTADLSVGGARIVSDRPLRVDEELRFDLALPARAEHLTGVARVLRQHRHDEYALRFESVDPDGVTVLGTFVETRRL